MPRMVSVASPSHQAVVRVARKAPKIRRRRINYPRKAAQARAQTLEDRPRESTLFSPVGKYLGGLAGSFLGGPAGAVIGSQLGSSAGSLVSKLTGFGSYKINRNTIMADTIPQFQNRMGDGSIRIRHKEFISDVISSSTPGLFQPITYAVSASDATTFPYLSQLAINFEEFAFEGLVFEFVTSSGSISSTGQLGTVVGAMQFNSLAAAYANKQQMEASTFSQSTVASQSCMFPIECDAAQTPSNGIFYNTRPGISSVNNDKRWSQLGNFTIATVGMPNASETVGELYVTYDVVLMKPILIQDSGSQADHWVNTSGAGVVIPGDYFGSAIALTPSSDNFTSLGPATIFINSSFNGKIAISYGVHCTGAPPLIPLQDPLFTAGVNAAPLNILDQNVTNQYLKNQTPAVDQVMWTTAYFIITSNGASASTIIISAGAVTGTTVDTVDLIVTQLPADFA